MSKEEIKDLSKFLQTFNEEKKEIAMWLREFVWDLYPTTNELIYDNYNALSFGWSPTEKVGHTFCSIAVGRTSGNIHFGFYWGSEISDPKNLLLGKGNQYRYIQVTNTHDFPKTYIKKLLKEAFDNSVKKVINKTQLVAGKTITKSISSVKRAKAVKPLQNKK